MSDKLGTSSYDAGDTGGACGDYHAMCGQHGVSQTWLTKKVSSAVKGMKRGTGSNLRFNGTGPHAALKNQNTFDSRLSKFKDKMAKHTGRTKHKAAKASSVASIAKNY